LKYQKEYKMSETSNRQSRLLVSLLLIAFTFTLVGNVYAAPLPESIPLPNGFQPEGIASGPGTTFYVGSIPTGAVYQGDFQTGEGEILVPAQDGRSAIGLKYDRRSNLLFVAGGATGYAYVYDADSGANVAEIQLSTLPSFINDVVIARDAAYFTNSFQPIIYRVPLLKNGQLPDPAMVEEIMLGGEYQFTPGAFNANGIAVTPNGRTLVIVNSTEGALYNVDPSTGVATHIDLGTGAVPNGDGILLQGRTLYVVQNQLNQIAVVGLNPKFTAGTIQTVVTSPLFRVPTTIASLGNALYVVNARFGTTPTPDTDYDVVRVPAIKY
jgi:sugar lactone lactonase YvrE